MKKNTKAWEILTTEEKSALSLSLSLGKSTWEAGEIMGKAHYKFLEMKARGEKFLRMFTEYFEITGNLLVPNRDKIPLAFEEYLEAIIIQRLPMKEAIALLSDPQYKKIRSRDKEIARILDMLSASKKDKLANLLFDMVIEFDRWNNFRIIPESHREPSAFKRRNKTRNLKQIKRLVKVPLISINIILNKYSYNGEGEKLYTALFNIVAMKDPIIFSISHTTKNINKFSRAGIYLFNTRDQANKFITCIWDYIGNPHKSPVDGQRFWPKFRNLSQLAINYDKLNHLDRCREFTEDDLDVMDIIKARKKEEKT